MSNKGSFYGISKLASEKIIEEYHKNKGLQIIRDFNSNAGDESAILNGFYLCMLT